jgi:hypothetical protein
MNENKMAFTPVLDSFKEKNAAARERNEKGCVGKFRGKSCNNYVAFVYPVKQCVTCFQMGERE